jgi:hypothetical protein
MVRHPVLLRDYGCLQLFNKSYTLVGYARTTSGASGGNMPDVTNISTISKGVTDLARDAAYVAVGLGVLGFQRAQVQRVELQNLLSKDSSLDQHLSSVRSELTKGVKQLDDLLENATQFIETSLQPLEAQLPASVTQLTTKAFEQTREVRSQIRQRVTAS